MLKVDHGSQDFSLFCLLAILQRSSSSLCSLQYRGQPPPRGWRQVSPAANGPAAFSLCPSQACKARARASAYQQYIPGLAALMRLALGACHGTKASSRGLGHTGLNGLCGLQCLCAAAAAADHTLHSSGIIVQLVRPSFLESWDLKKGLLLYQHSHILVDQRRTKK